ncbi:hypothetical protein RJT34_13644 [Clitoria ternatea]|uniref:Uncharacterized protein n=1 Tax=Clitoria ternatea TaxID=43366 RepID=A0AAN9PLZ3_CLITE
MWKGGLRRKKKEESGTPVRKWVLAKFRFWPNDVQRITTLSFKGVEWGQQQSVAWDSQVVRPFSYSYGKCQHSLARLGCQDKAQGESGRESAYSPKDSHPSTRGPIVEIVWTQVIHTPFSSSCVFFIFFTVPLILIPHSETNCCKC